MLIGPVCVAGPGAGGSIEERLKRTVASLGASDTVFLIRVVGRVQSWPASNERLTDNTRDSGRDGIPSSRQREERGVITCHRLLPGGKIRT